MRVNLLKAHGTTFRYHYRGCRCSSCRGAIADYQRQYRASHPEKVEQSRETARRRYHADPERERARRETERRTHPERVAATQRRYRERHPDRVKAKDKAHRAKSCDHIREQARKYRAENRDSFREWNRAWRKDHPEAARAISHARRARELDAPGTHTATDIAAQRTRQHGKCYWCREKVGRHYHVDHVMPLALGGSDGPENLVIACPSCNQKKAATHPMDFAGVML